MLKSHQFLCRYPAETQKPSRGLIRGWVTILLLRFNFIVLDSIIQNSIYDLTSRTICLMCDLVKSFNSFLFRSNSENDHVVFAF